MADGDQKTRVKLWILLTTSLVSSLIMLDSNIVAVSLPTIGRALGANFTQIEWAINSYLLSYAALLFAAGSFADLCGRKKTMMIGLVVFASASTACGIATSSTMLNIARSVQGIGGALLLTAALAIISNTFIGVERAHAFAVWGACLGAALTSGPILGGTITRWFGWRWIFLINVPVCVLLVIATILFISESRDTEAKTLDFVGIVTFSPALFFLIWALADGNEMGWGTWRILLRFASAAILFVTFAIAELRQPRPMVDFSLFKHRTFVGAVLAMLGYGAAAQVMIFLLPLFLQNVFEFGPARTGLAMMPFAIPMVLTPRVFGSFEAKTSGRCILALGLAVTCLGNLLFWLVARAGSSYPMFAIVMAVAGVGAGLLNGETVKVLGGSVPAERAGMASGISSTTRFIGILVSVAGLSAVLSHVSQTRFIGDATRYGLSRELSFASAKRVTSGDIIGMLSAAPTYLQPKLRLIARMSFAEGFASASLLAAFIAAAAGLLAYRYIEVQEISSSLVSSEESCKVVDCRHPI